MHLTREVECTGTCIQACLLSCPLARKAPTCMCLKSLIPARVTAPSGPSTCVLQMETRVNTSSPSTCAVIALADVAAVLALLVMHRMFSKSVEKYSKEQRAGAIELADYTVFVTGLPHDQSEELIEEGLRLCVSLSCKMCCSCVLLDDW